MRYDRINSELFIKNRQNFTKQMKPGSLAVFVSNDIITRSADSAYKWRQNPDLFYLSGIDQEETFLILFPDAPEEKYKEVLFVRKTSELIAWWEGKKHSKEEATAFSGIDTVLWSEQFNSIFQMLMHYTDVVYLNAGYYEHDRSISIGRSDAK